MLYVCRFIIIPLAALAISNRSNKYYLNEAAAQKG